MSDDRPYDDVVARLALLEREVADFRSTAMARVSRRPTGSIEPTFASTAPAGALLLQGQTLNRADFPALWQWASTHGAVTGAAFGAGNGSTTFTLPDMRGRWPVGVGTLGSDTYVLGQVVGAARHTLTSAEIPAHTHPHTFDSAGLHDHGGTGTSGSHSGHNSGATAIQSGSGNTVATTTQNSLGSHSHSIADSGSHTHGFSVNSNTGGGGSHENRPPSIAWNWLVWT